MTDRAPDPALLRTRALLALSFTLARYVPLPILDDLVRDRLGRIVVTRAAAAQGVTLEPSEAAMLGGSSEGCLGCLGSLVWWPVKLVLYPFRALLGVALGIRWASRDLVEIFALGRTVDRLLAAGLYPVDSPLETRLAYARDARRAFDAARRGLDTNAVQGLLSVALGPLRGVVPAAMRPLRRFWHGDVPAPAPVVEAPASRLAAALDDPRMQALLAEIDRRFDAAMLLERAKSA